MKKTALLALFAAAAAQLLSGCLTHPSPAPGPQPTSHAYTPAKGSEERNAILHATHVAMEKLDPAKKTLVVPYLKANAGWAWIQVNPQSADGTQHYESQSGLLQKTSPGWTLLEWMPAEEGLNTDQYFLDLRKKYPAAPADIFPN